MVFRKILSLFSLKDGFLKSVFYYMSFTALAQVIPLLISPVLTRIYSPEEFGSMTLFVSVISFLSVFANGKYALALSMPKTDEEGIKLLQFASILSFCFGLVILFVYLFMSKWFATTIEHWGITSIFWLIGPCVFFYSMSEILSYWLNRKERFKKSSSSQIIRTGVNSFSSLLGRPVFPTSTLEISQFLGHFFAAIYLFAQVLKLEGTKVIQFFAFRKLIDAGKRYSSFPKINMVHSFLDKLNSEGIVFLISFFFTGGVLGLFGLYVRIVKMPISVIGAAFGQVLFQRCIKIKNDQEEMKPFINGVVKKLALIALIPFVLMLALGPQLFGFALGVNWTEAGKFAQITSPLIFFQFIASPLAFLPIALERQKTSFYYNLIGNLIQLGAYGIGSFFGTIYVALTLSTILGCIYYILYLIWLWKIADYKPIRHEEGA